MAKPQKQWINIGGLDGNLLEEKLRLADSGSSEFDDWCLTLTPDERMQLVEELTLRELRKRGISEIPRLDRTICITVKRKDGF